MDKEFYRRFDGFVKAVDWCLDTFDPRTRGTASNDRWKCYYVKDSKGKEHFVAHVRPVLTKRRANICIGLTGAEFEVPAGCPNLELRDKSHPNYREFDVPMDEIELYGLTLVVLARVAQVLSEKK